MPRIAAIVMVVYIELKVPENRLVKVDLRCADSDPVGRGFDSLLARHLSH